MAYINEKGKQLENYVAEEIIKRGLDNKASRSIGSGSGNREKSDVWTMLKLNKRNIFIECKNHKILQIPKWWKKTEKQADKQNRTPALVFKLDRDPYENTLITIRLEDLLDILSSGVTVEKVVEEPDARQIKYTSEQIRTLAKKLLDLISK